MIVAFISFCFVQYVTLSTTKLQVLIPISYLFIFVPLCLSSCRFCIKWILKWLKPPLFLAPSAGGRSSSPISPFLSLPAPLQSEDYLCIKSKMEIFKRLRESRKLLKKFLWVHRREAQRRWDNSFIHYMVSVINSKLGGQQGHSVWVNWCPAYTQERINFQPHQSLLQKKKKKKLIKNPISRNPGSQTIRRLKKKKITSIWPATPSNIKLFALRRTKKVCK